MNNVTDINSARPHRTTSIECKQCNYKWQAVYPEKTQWLECPGCHVMVNEYGTEVSVHKCKTCGSVFSVCPPVSSEKLSDWDNCLGVECDSYDESRDADKMFDAGIVKRDDEE